MFARSGFLIVFGLVLCLNDSARSAPPASEPVPSSSEHASLEWLQISDDGKHFIGSASGQPMRLWGVNYDHDDDGRLLEDYWQVEWERVAEDFLEIKSLGANVVRIHLQLGRFMDSATEANAEQLGRLKDLIQLAEETELYLDLTGLGCYHKQDVPSWYDALDERSRWEVQGRFWGAVARVGRQSPAVFCYDLMNEPIVTGGQEPATEWLTGELGGKFFVQRINLDASGRTTSEIARDWVQHLTSAIRAVDDRHLITVGVIPWAHVFPGAKPLFYSPEVGEPLDFVSVHFYPKRGEVEAALKALAVYDVGKPIVIEEMFPLSCSIEELQTFVDGSRPIAQGWISFYWGTTIDEYETRDDLRSALIAQWLRAFRDMDPNQSTRSEQP